jgi:hypothetical protein
MVPAATGALTIQTTMDGDFQEFCRSPLTDSNRRPPPYHGGALPTELRGRCASVAPFGPAWPLATPPRFWNGAREAPARSAGNSLGGRPTQKGAAGWVAENMADDITIVETKFGELVLSTTLGVSAARV